MVQESIFDPVVFATNIPKCPNQESGTPEDSRGENDSIDDYLATIDLEVRDETGLDRKLRVRGFDRG